MGEEPGVDLHHPGGEPAGLGRQRLPVRHIGIVAGQLGAGRHDAELLLSGEHPLPIDIPALVELPPVAVRPLPRHVVRGVRRTGAEVQVERLVWGDLLGVGDELDRLVRQILTQVVALLRGAGRFDLVVVVVQVRGPLAGVPAEEAVEPLEPAAQGPAVVRAGRGLVLRGHQVPLADHVGAVALLHQHLRQEAVLERDAAVVAGVPGGDLVDRRRRVRMVVAAGDDARAGRRTQRGGVHVRVEQPARSQRVDARRGDWAAVAVQLPNPVSSNTTTSTFGAPGTARSGRGHAGLDSSTVRPITPGNPVPDLYSFSHSAPSGHDSIRIRPMSNNIAAQRHSSITPTR